MSPQITQYLDDFLAGKQSEAQVREVLLLIDDSGALLSEFTTALESIHLKVPGLGLNYEKLFASDPVECDPLVSQGNLAILRLNTIYYQAYDAWTKSGGDLHRYKRITKAETPATYSDRTEKHERIDQNYPPDAQLLNQVVNIALSAFRVQATITHRREQLLARSTSKASREMETRSVSEEIDSPFQSAASPSNHHPNSAISAPPRETNPDIITAEESLADAIHLIESFESDLPRINNIYKLRKLNGYNHLDPLTNNSKSEFSADSAPPRETKNQTVPTPPNNTNEIKNHSDEIREVKAVTKNTTNQVLRPNPHSAIAEPPRETNHFTNNKPHFHKRE